MFVRLGKLNKEKMKTFNKKPEVGVSTSGGVYIFDTSTETYMKVEDNEHGDQYHNSKCNPNFCRNT